VLRATRSDDAAGTAGHDPTQNAALAKPVLVRLGFYAEIANETTRAAVPTWAWTLIWRR